MRIIKTDQDSPAELGLRNGFLPSACVAPPPSILQEFVLMRLALCGLEEGNLGNCQRKVQIVGGWKTDRVDKTQKAGFKDRRDTTESYSGKDN